MNVNRNPLVSVIVTTFNKQKELSRCIKHILNQTYSNIELIVIDDCSSYDFFGEMNLITDSRIRYFQNNSFKVIGTNRNFGLKYASGDYVAFCDDDDFWFPEKLQKQIAYIYDNNFQDDNVVIHTNAINYTVASQKRTSTHAKAIHSIDDFIYGNHVILSSSLVTFRSLKNRFSELPEFFAVEDFLFWCELKMNNFGFHLIEEALLEYTVSNNSSSMRTYGINHIRSILIIVFIAIRRENAHNPFKVAFAILVHGLKYLAKATIKRFRR